MSQKIYNELEKWFPNSSYESKAYYLYYLASHACGYVSEINSLFKHYEGKEEEFYNTFGFNMYNVDKNGNIDFNYEYLILEFYDYAWMNDGEYQMNDLYSFSTGFCDDCGKKFASYLKDYYDIDAITSLNGGGDTRSCLYTKEDIISTYKQLTDSGVDHIMICSWGYRLLDYETKAVSYYSNEGNGHAMSVIGIENNNLIVSSWGKKYILDLDHMDNYEMAESYFHITDY